MMCASSYGETKVSERALAMASARSRAWAKLSPSWTTSAPKEAQVATFTSGAQRGMTTVTGMPRHCPW
jgi:hypothetical protein